MPTSAVAIELTPQQKHPRQMPSPKWGHRLSGWYLVALCAALTTVRLSVGPLAETDAFWHIEAGQQLLEHHLRFPWPDPWSFTLPQVHWSSTAWLSEVVFYGVFRLGGPVAVSALRIALVAALCIVLARKLLPTRTPWIGAAVFAVTVLPLSAFDQERPQLISFLFLVWLSWLAHGIYRGTRAPVVWQVGLVTWLWANFHGYWALAPATLVFLALLLLGRPAGFGAARRCWAAAGAALLGAALTPAGPSLLLTPLTVSSAARGLIAEWQPAHPTMPYAVGIDLFLVALIACWARSGVRIPRSELLWVLAWTAYAFTAGRNLAPAALLLAPWVLERVELTYGDGRQGPRVPVGLLVAVGAVILGAIGFLQARAPAIDPARPSRIASTLAAQTQPLRVLNDYNVSGFLILRGGDNIRLAVDGRADRYGSAFIRRYINAVGGVDWKPLVRQLAPDVAVLERKSPLAEDLTDIGWHQMLTDGGWTLLVRPQLTLTPA